MNRSLFILIASIIVLVASCGGVPYKFYGIIPSEQKLLGEKPEDDKPLIMCEPDDISKGKCIVFFVDEFERLFTDFNDVKQRLKECEKNNSIK